MVIIGKQNSLGGSIAKGIGAGINNLIDKKVADLQRQNQINERKKTYAKAELPEWLAELPENMQSLLIKEYDLSTPEEKEEFRQIIDKAAKNGTPTKEDLQEEEPEQESPQLLGGQTPEPEQQGVQPRPSKFGDFAQQQFLGMPEESQNRIPGLNNLMQAGQGGQRQPGRAQSTQDMPRLGKGTSGAPAPQEALAPESAIAQPRTGEPRRKGLMRKGERLEREKLNLERFKHTKDLRDTITNEAKASNGDLRDLERIEELEKEGKLDTPGYVEFLKRSGLNIPALQNEGSEEFQKITQNFMRNAKQYFGGNISNFEVEQFLKTIPSLSQSPEGRKRVISNMKRIARTNWLTLILCEKLPRSTVEHLLKT